MGCGSGSGSPIGGAPVIGSGPVTGGASVVAPGPVKSGAPVIGSVVTSGSGSDIAPHTITCMHIITTTLNLMSIFLFVEKYGLCCSKHLSNTCRTLVRHC